MNGFRESDKSPRDETLDGGYDSPAPRHYDPLFASGEEDQAPAASDLESDVDFLLSGSRPHGVQWREQAKADEALAWELPPVEPFRMEPRRDASAADWYRTPTPYASPYQPAEAQLLRPAAIAIPPPQSRVAAALWTLWGLCFLAFGFVLATGTFVSAQPGETRLVWVGALGIGTVWSLYGFAGLVLDRNLPFPEIRVQREVFETVLLAALIFLSVRGSFQNFKVEGASMQPSLQDGEFIIVNKLTYAEIDLSIFNWLPFFQADEAPVHHLWDAPSRGDVIVFRAPISIDRDFIKRVIGLPGDTIEINEGTGQVLVNGTVLNEPYIQGTTNCNVSCTRVVPAANSPEARADCGSNACYFVMGDNRQNSSDSRQGWLVPEENIIGKAQLTYCLPFEIARCINGKWADIGTAPNHSVQVASEVSAEE